MKQSFCVILVKKGRRTEEKGILWSGTMRRKKITAILLALCLGMGVMTPVMGNMTVFAKSNTISYEITGENKNEKLKMNNQPMASCWFPEELLQWNPKEDPDLSYNISHVPLAKRAKKDVMEPVNDSQNKDTKVMAISIMNASTSGNAPHGLNTAKSNTFSYYQYVDTLVYWGGSSGEGIIVPPSPDVTDSAHKNGVPVLGTVFFPQTAHGGKLEWLDTFLKKEDGQFKMADKLIEVARTYGFDGWFINQETEGTSENPLTKKHADLMQEFILEIKGKAPDLEIVYYDSMTKDGEMDWQNALTDKNAMFLQTEDKKSVADSMFLNFWWYSKSYVDQKLLEASKEKAQQLGIDPYTLYAGIDVQADGYNTPIRWDLFEKTEDSTQTSLGIYCPSWTYFSSENKEEFYEKENTFWVNEQGDPSVNSEQGGNTDWKGISTYITERTPVTSFPFVTNFSLGNGYNFFINGKKVSKMNWNNRSLSDVLPTYRWMIDEEGNNDLKASIDMSTAWYGGNSLKFAGKMEKGKKSTITLYRTDLKITDDVVYTTTAKATSKGNLDLVVILSDGTKKVIKGDKKLGKDWTTISYDLASLAGKTVREISYQMTADADQANMIIRLGNITAKTEQDEKVSPVSNVKVDGVSFDEDGMYAGIRLSWAESKNAQYYEVYQGKENGTRSFLGAVNNNSFFVNALPRDGKSNETKLLVIPVSKFGQRGTGETAIAYWPDNSKPKADFTVSKTLVPVGESVTFTSQCSENTQEVIWTLDGASKKTAKGKNVTVTYEKEGVYDVTVTANNEEGSEKKTIKGCIVVKKDVPKQLTLLSNNCNATASSYVNENEAPPFAVDGDSKTKWCATGNPPHELVLDLKESSLISEVEILHAQAGGEGADMNTKAYTISVSEDGEQYEDVVTVTRNTKGETKDTFAPRNARYVKLTVDKPTQGSDTAVRIYEVKVNGMKN